MAPDDGSLNCQTRALKTAPQPPRGVDQSGGRCELTNSKMWLNAQFRRDVSNEAVISGPALQVSCPIGRLMAAVLAVPHSPA
jgi:hypothetical protein